MSELYPLVHMKISTGEEIFCEVVREYDYDTYQEMLIRRACVAEPIALSDVSRSFLLRPWMLGQADINDISVFDINKIVARNDHVSDIMRLQFFKCVISSVQIMSERDQNYPVTQEDLDLQQATLEQLLTPTFTPVEEAVLQEEEEATKILKKADSKIVTLFPDVSKLKH